MVNSPRISVLMNSRNAPEFLVDAIRSVLWQRETSLELILCEASDDDEGVRIAAAFDDPRLIVIRDRERLGWAHGANLAFERCRGTFVAFAAGDDIFHPECLGRMADALDGSGRGTAVVPVRAIDGQGVPTGRTVRVPPDVRQEPTWCRLFERNHIIFALTRRNCLPTPLIDESIPGVGGDWHLWLRLIEAGSGFFYLDELLFDYRVHGASLVARHADTRNDMGAVLAKFDEATIEACYRRAGYGDEIVREAKLWMAVARGRRQQALELATLLEAACPDDVRWPFQTATSLLLLGRADEARARLEKWVAATPAPEGWNNLGVALARCGDRRAASESFARALALWPDYRDARCNLTSDSATWITERPLRPLDQIVR
jgi:glycosyltransferase involved in cell wall biosynthesis